MRAWSVASSVVVSVVCLLVAGPSRAAAPRELTFDQRVQCQRAIEEVNWNHRTWPEVNRRAKPALAEVMSDEALRAKVRTTLDNSRALEDRWQRPLTTAQLQAELDRMAKNTQDGARLREIFHALGDDPFLAAECLARPLLA